MRANPSPQVAILLQRQNLALIRHDAGEHGVSPFSQT
jgi:hypothetical protein